MWLLQKWKKQFLGFNVQLTTKGHLRTRKKNKAANHCIQPSVKPSDEEKKKTAAQKCVWLLFPNPEVTY